MHYRKNHNSVTGPTWKYPRYLCTFLVPVPYPHVVAGSLSSWTTCWGRTCATTTSTGLRTTRSAPPAISTSHLSVSLFLKINLGDVHSLFSGHFETLYWDLHLLANKTCLSQWDDTTVSDRCATKVFLSRDIWYLNLIFKIHYCECCASIVLSPGLLPVGDSPQGVRRVLCHSWERGDQKTLQKVKLNIPQISVYCVFIWIVK